MNINIVKGVRKVKLTKRERDLLVNAKELLSELGSVAHPLSSDECETAVTAIGNVLAYMDGTPLLTGGAALKSLQPKEEKLAEPF